MFSSFWILYLLLYFKSFKSVKVYQQEKKLFFLTPRAFSSMIIYALNCLSIHPCLFFDFGACPYFVLNLL
jgi:hypothetical protein